MLITTCMDCIYCVSANYEYEDCNVIERYCECDTSIFNNGAEINELVCGKCSFFKHKDIVKDDFNNIYSIEIKTSRNTISCKCTDFNTLNNFLHESSIFLNGKIESERKFEKLKEKIGKLKNFIEFFKNELPDVYKQMCKEHNKIKETKNK